MRSASKREQTCPLGLLSISSASRPLVPFQAAKVDFRPQTLRSASLRIRRIACGYHWKRGQNRIFDPEGSGGASGSLHRSIGIEMELGQYADGKVVYFLQIPTLVAGFLQQSFGAM